MPKYYPSNVFNILQKISYLSVWAVLLIILYIILLIICFVIWVYFTFFRKTNVHLIIPFSKKVGKDEETDELYDEQKFSEILPVFHYYIVTHGPLEWVKTTRHYWT